jgi:hypothetical protein
LPPPSGSCRESALVHRNSHWKTSLRFEQANGNCRLMGSFAAQLSETAVTWRRAVSPYAEEAAKIFLQGRSKKSRFTLLPTRLTQTRRSLAKSGNLVANVATVPKTSPRCQQTSQPARCIARNAFPP